jgi:hypothetical protein
MADAQIYRRTRTVDITLTTATSSATTLQLDDMAGAVVSFGTMSTNASTLQMWGCDTQGGTYKRVYKADGTVADVTLAPSTAAGRIYAMPDEVYALPFLKILSAHTAATGVAGVVVFKS